MPTPFCRHEQSASAFNHGHGQSGLRLPKKLPQEACLLDGTLLQMHPWASIADDAASSILEEEKCNKNKANDIGIQAFYAVLQLGEGYWLIALLLSCDVLGPNYMPHSCWLP